ncbi:serine/threonine protein kinase with Chase2 sensor [Calothrix sp. NIES-4071]|nr:serine/threonine protein kinase with Chase2 sensor [Calothrix sp. NIES-4071]BAZ60294.1 serine/threonine protein kinase with Chase2 sensor [Calothrix sp. NIES-4105]
MNEEPTPTLTKKYVPATDQQSSRTTKSTSTTGARQYKKIARFGHWLAFVWTVGAGLLTISSLRLPSMMENQAQSAFYQFRGSIAPPKDIIILAIDDASISTPAVSYATDPVKYGHLEPLKGFPYKREAYARVIEKLVQAGARVVALDVIFDLPSSYGEEDDRKLQAALQRYGSKVVLAASYETFDTDSGSITQLRSPQGQLRVGSVSTGSVNFPIEVDGKIHRFAGEYTKELTETQGSLLDKIPDFSTATLRAANIDYPKPLGDRIYYRGSAGSFEQIPFWHVFDQMFWDSNLQSGKVFKDKIVIIGATATAANDFHSVAVNWLFPERMAGVEIHANAIATLKQGNSVRIAFNTRYRSSLFVLVLVGGSAYFISRKKYNRVRVFTSFSIAIAWGVINYILFVSSQLFLPTAIPIIALLAIGLSYLGIEIAIQQLRKIQLVDIIQKNPYSRIAQEILSQQEDLIDLLKKREIQISGKILDGRYRIVKVLGSGGFSETYIAEDTRLPGNPLCVVKQLQPVNNKPEQLEVARRLFSSEAQTLQQLGTHPQIPQLMAYFEEDEEFYLVQEFIDGNSLSQELPSGKRHNQGVVIEMLCELLQILKFVHQKGVIHRDIKPSNIMRRKSDHQLVLIDFGAVKQVSTNLLENLEDTAFTIGIGTKGYAPREQCFGRPQYSSDIYAVGMIGIKALTGVSPHELQHDDNGELIWIERAEVATSFANILNKMVRDSFQERYQTATDALNALNKLISADNIQPLPLDNLSINTQSLEDSEVPTIPWDGN